MIASLFQWITSNATALGVVVAAAPLLWAVVQFIITKRAENRRVRFETYHSLIKQLVERETPDAPKMLDRQIAVVFELRNFKHYFPVTLRMLKGLREEWDDYGPEKKRNRLLEELDLAIAYMEKKI